MYSVYFLRSGSIQMCTAKDFKIVKDFYMLKQLPNGRYASEDMMIIAREI